MIKAVETPHYLGPGDTHPTRFKPLARFRSWGHRSWEQAMEENVRVIEHVLATLRPATLLDLGCDIGVNTVRFARAAGAGSVNAVEIAPGPVEEARRHGIDVTVADLSEPLPFDDASVDAIVSDQVIEHVVNTDHFIAEAFRVVKPAGA